MFWFLPSAGVTVSGENIGWWDTAVSTITTTEGGTLTDGDRILSLTDLSSHADTASAAGTDRPVADLVTAPGAVLVECINDRHLAAAQDADVVTIMGMIWVPSTVPDRTIAARDTGAATDKPAWMLELDA